MMDPMTTEPGAAPADADPTGGDFVDALLGFIDAEVSQLDEPIAPDTDLLLTGAVDSLGVVMVVDWIERRLGRSIDPGDVVLENFQTVALMVRFLREG